MINPNNTHDADLQLIDEMGCSTIITTDRYIGRFEKILEQRSALSVIYIPDLDHWLKEGSVNAYPSKLPNTEKEALETPWEVLHTSGTTGESTCFLEGNK